MPDEKNLIIQQMQEKLMFDMANNFDLLTIPQRLELIRKLQKDFCLSCGDERRIENLSHGYEK